MLDKFLRESHKTVVFSGAGMSTESGLSDFRSADSGMWNHRDLAELASIDSLVHHREEFERFYRWRIDEMQRHGPNFGHHVLAKWEDNGLIAGIITQNVENYHELAGSKRISKLHGNLGVVRCQTCAREYSSDRYLTDPDFTACPRCSGYLRPGVILFGETLSHSSLGLADNLFEGVELLVVLGSSLVVSPANVFPKLAKKREARLVIVNLETTPLDDIADMVIRESIGSTLSWTDNQLMKT